MRVGRNDVRVDIVGGGIGVREVDVGPLRHVDEQRALAAVLGEVQLVPAHVRHLETR